MSGIYPLRLNYGYLSCLVCLQQYVRYISSTPKLWISILSSLSIADVRYISSTPKLWIFILSSLSTAVCQVYILYAQTGYLSCLVCLQQYVRYISSTPELWIFILSSLSTAVCQVYILYAQTMDIYPAIFVENKSATSLSTIWSILFRIEISAIFVYNWNQRHFNLKLTQRHLCLKLKSAPSLFRIEIQEGRANLKCPQCCQLIHPNDIEFLVGDDTALLQLYQFLMVRRVLAADPDTR